MIQISYLSAVLLISSVWIFVRGYVCTKRRSISWKRELQLMLVYICIVVVARFTFFPFSRIDGKIQPLIFNMAQIFPLRVNLIPMVNLLDYEIFREMLINVIGNTTMFIPLGIVWPSVFRKLDTHGKVIGAGVGFSLCIEILQLPFYDRVSDVDDLILNSLGFLIGYGIYLLVKVVKRKIHK